MAHIIRERPNALCMSKNEIRYVYFVSSPDRLGLYLEAQLFYRTKDTDSYSSLPSFKLSPNDDGNVYVYIQYYIDSILQFVLPSVTDTITAADKQSLLFYLAVREVEDASVGVIDWDNAENEFPRIALKMGVEKNRYSRNNLFNYLSDNNLFLTWQPNNRLIFPTQPTFLSFLLTEGNCTGYKLKVVFQTIQGTNDDIITALPSLAAYLFHIRTDIASLGITIPEGEQLHWWEVSIIDSNNLVKFGTYRYYADYDTIYYCHDFIYTNSLGGIDAVRAKGELQYSFERQTEEIEGGFTTNEWNTQIKNAETTYRAINLRRTFKGDLGYRKSKLEQSAMIELLASTAVYEILDGRMIPLLHIQKTQTLRKTTDQILPFPIEWQYAETNEVFTPNTISLGMGAETETYPSKVWVVNNSPDALGFMMSIPLSTDSDTWNIERDVAAFDTFRCDYIYRAFNDGNLRFIIISKNGIGTFGTDETCSISLFVNNKLIQTILFRLVDGVIVFNNPFTVSIGDVLQFVID